jgi:hypothetical protein
MLSYPLRLRDSCTSPVTDVGCRWLKCEKRVVFAVEPLCRKNVAACDTPWVDRRKRSGSAENRTPLN